MVVNEALVQGPVGATLSGLDQYTGTIVVPTVCEPSVHVLCITLDDPAEDTIFVGAGCQNATAARRLEITRSVSVYWCVQRIKSGGMDAAQKKIFSKWR